MMTLRVHAGPYPRRCCPVEVALELDPTTRVTLLQQPGGRPRACQLVPEGKGSRLHWLLTRLPAGQTQEYRLQLTPRRRQPVGRFRWSTLGEDHWQLSLDGQLLASLDLRAERIQPGLKLFRGTETTPILDDLLITARLIDRAHHQTPMPLVESPQRGPSFAEVRLRGFWKTAQAQPILEEIRQLRFFATPRGHWLMDLGVVLRASVGPVSFANDRGLVYFQLASPLRSPAAWKVRTAEGLQPGNLATPWLHISGNNCGLALFDHPSNLGAPCRWQVGDAVSTLPFAGLQRFDRLLPSARLVLQTGEALRFLYRLYWHEGTAARGAVRGVFANLVEPPRVEVLG